METGLDTEKRQLLDERAARVRAEALLLEKEQFIAQLLQQNEDLQSQLSSVDGLKKELHYVNENKNWIRFNNRRTKRILNIVMHSKN